MGEGVGDFSTRNLQVCFPFRLLAVDGSTSGLKSRFPTGFASEITITIPGLLLDTCQCGVTRYGCIRVMGVGSES